MFKSGIRIGSIMTLILAGAVHSFSGLWKWWESLLIEKPEAHLVIGSIALFFGVLSSVVYMHEIVSKKINKV